MAELAYILAASHSGSTLLAMLLNGHPEVCTAGELKATNLGDVERYRCSCGELIRKCTFWARVSAGMARRGIAFDITAAGTDYRGNGSAYTRRLLGPLHRGPVLEAVRDAALWLSPAWRRHMREVQFRNTALVEALCEVSGARIIADSSKNPLRLKYLLRNADLRVKVVRLLRDGRAVALTYMDPAQFADASNPALRGGGSGGDRKSERFPMAEAAYRWRRNNEAIENALATLDRTRWIEVRYEDLCAAPEKTLGAVFTFLGLDPRKAAKDFRSREHHVLGNGMRLDSTSEVRLDERWKTALSAQDLNVFNSVAGAMNRRYGYA